MIESVQVRQKGVYDFDTHYTDLCLLQNDVPLPTVRAHLHRAVLDINGDKIRAVDWVPILNTLKINKSLETVALRSFYKPSPSDTDKPGAGLGKRKIPALRSKEITYRLSRALKDCLGTTTSLSCLELQGLPLRERDLVTLTKEICRSFCPNFQEICISTGIADLLFVQHLVIRVREVLSKGLKTAIGINSLNFSGCSLSWKGADIIAQVIKHQAMTRHNDAWKDSLRYRRPDLDRMPGIRRITANNNPLISDQGALVLADVLKDDLWLKALDMQACGVTSSGAQGLLDVLKYNTTMVVLDLRNNPLIDKDTLHSITEQLHLNTNEETTQYKLLDLPPKEDPPAKLKPVVRRRRTKTLNSNFGRKTTIKVGTTAPRRRTKSVGSMNPVPNTGSTTTNQGFAWRTAARANRLKGCPPNGSTGSFDDISTDSAESPRMSAAPTVDYRCEEMYTYPTVVTTTATRTPRVTNVARDLKVEVEQLKRRLREETEARVRADDRIVELTIENSRLRNALNETKQGGVLDDDQILESIEASFKQFHAFLDLLRDAGFGKLANLANLDASQALQTSLCGDKPPQQNDTANKLKPQQKQNHITNAGTASHSNTMKQKKLQQNQATSMIKPQQNYTEKPLPQKFLIGGIDSPVKIDKTNNIANVTFRDYGDPTMQQNNTHSDLPLKTDDLYTKLVHETRGVFPSDADFEAKFFKSNTHDVDMSGIFPVMPETELTFDKRMANGAANSTANQDGDVDLTPTNKNIIPSSEQIPHERNSSENAKSANCPGENENVTKKDFCISDLQDVDTLLESLDIDARGDDYGLSREGPADNFSQNYTMDSVDHSYMSEHGELVHLGDETHEMSTMSQ